LESEYPQVLKAVEAYMDYKGNSLGKKDVHKGLVFAFAAGIILFFVSILRRLISELGKNDFVAVFKYLMLFLRKR